MDPADSADSTHVRSNLLQSCWRGSYWFIRDLSYLWRARLPEYVVYCGGTGFGDDLLLTSVLEELRRRGHRRLAVISRLEEIFRHSPREVRFFCEEWRLIEAARLCRSRVVHPQYFVRQEGQEYDVPSRRHFITHMCFTAGLTGAVDLRPYFYLQDEERTRGRVSPNQVVIQCTSPETLGYSPLKHWSVAKYQEIADRLSTRFDVIQLGSGKEPSLTGVLDLRGKTNIRESAAILAQSRFYFGYAGFLMHLARAVECRSVIVYGGRERPDQSGYIANENLFTELPCSPCWRRYQCDFAHECMTRVDVDAAAAAIERLLGRTDHSLEVATEVIPDRAEAFDLPWLGRSPVSPGAT